MTTQTPAHEPARVQVARPPIHLQRACSCGGHAGPSGTCSACAAADEKLEVQRKLTVNRPGDRFEQEADRVAEQVLSGTGPLSVRPAITSLEPRTSQGSTAVQPRDPVQRQDGEEEEEMLQAEMLQRDQMPEEEEPVQAELLQRDQMPEEEEPVQAELLQRDQMPEEEEPVQAELLQRDQMPEEEEPVQAMPLQREPGEEEEEEAVQASAAGPTRASAPVFAQQLDATRSAGRPINGSLRSDFEPRFGRDLSSVRLHEGADAARMSRQINARAFTWRNHIYFGTGQLDQASSQGRRLLAHEITHVLQQTGAAAPPIQRDLAIEPEHFGTASARTLSAKDITAAIDFNKRRFHDPYTLAVIRDALEITRYPAVSDQALAKAVGRWQANHGIAEDGQIGPVTAMYIVEELQAKNLQTDALQVISEFPKGTFLDVDTSFCGCEAELTGEVKDANFFIAEYTACGADKSNTSGADIEQCINDRAKARGQKLQAAGTTSASGQIKVATTKGKCGPLMDRITLAHEQIHSEDVSTLRQKHGSGAGFNAAFDDPQAWVQDEVQSRDTDIAVANWMSRILARICP